MTIELRPALAALMILLVPLMAHADRSERKREAIDLNARQTLERLFDEKSKAKALYDQAVGYAVFDVVKVSLVVTGGGGQGVAVDKTTGQRIYMNMGTGGVNLGLGGKSYNIVFLFQSREKFDDFIDNGWQGGISADATAGTVGKDVGADFINGVAYFQLTDAGLMLQADLTGTKYWRADKLN
ncbi:MAG: YSC84-related protein [Pseudomonadota bacterium]